MGLSSLLPEWEAVVFGENATVVLMENQRKCRQFLVLPVVSSIVVIIPNVAIRQVDHISSKVVPVMDRIATDENSRGKQCWVMELLSPSMFMSPLAEQCHSVVLASGSLSPIMSLCGELGLTIGPTEEDVKKAAAKRNLEAEATLGQGIGFPDSSIADTTETIGGKSCD